MKILCMSPSTMMWVAQKVVQQNECIVYVELGFIQKGSAGIKDLVSQKGMLWWFQYNTVITIHPCNDNTVITIHPCYDNTVVTIHPCNDNTVVTVHHLW